MQQTTEAKEFEDLAQESHLPYTLFLKGIDPSEVLAMAIGTFRYKSNDEGEYLDELFVMLERLGSKYGKKWQEIDFIARVEGGHSSMSNASIKGKTHMHLHFLIFKKGIVDATSSELEVEQAIKHIKRSWGKGICLVQRYDDVKHRWNGISYVMKSTDGMRAADYADTSRLSLGILERTLFQYRKAA